MWRWLWWWAGGSNSDLLVAVLMEVGAELEVKTEVIERGTGGRATAAGDVVKAKLQLKMCYCLTCGAFPVYSYLQNFSDEKTVLCGRSILFGFFFASCLSCRKFSMASNSTLSR